MKWLLSYPEDGPSVTYYQRWVRACGAEPVLLDAHYTHPGAPDGFAALLLSGGGDVDPARYGQQPHARTYGVLPARDAVEEQLIGEFLARGRPVFGICRGAQILNVVRGGALLQHVPDRVDPEQERHSRQEAYDARHAVAVDAATRLGQALAGVTETNSAHHQAVDPDRLGRDLRIVARSGCGVVEAVEGPGCSAVQWHPERLPLEHPASARLRAYWRDLARG